MLCLSLFFFFNDTATTEIYTLSLHDALPISRSSGLARRRERGGGPDEVRAEPRVRAPAPSVALVLLLGAAHAGAQESAAPTRLEPVVVTPTRLDQQAGHAPGTVALLTRRAPS